MRFTFLSLSIFASLCLILTLSQDSSTNQFPSGVTAYIKLQSRNSEVIICEKSSSVTSQLKSTISTFFTDKEQIQRFLEKGFLFKTKTENCTGLLYHSQPEIIKQISLSKLQQQLPASAKDAFKKHTSESNTDIKIEGKDSSVVVTFVSENAVHEFSRKGGETQVRNLTEKANGNITAVKGVANLTGSGLHQNMTKTFFIEKNDGEKVQIDAGKTCSIVLLDILSEETYVDQDEIRYLEYMDLKRFEVLDIEKPTETAKQYVWMVKLDVDNLIERSKSLQEMVISYLVHFRYQNPRDDAEYSDSHLLLKTKFFTDCEYGDNAGKIAGDSVFYEEKVKELYGNEYKQLLFEQSTSKGGKVEDEIIVKVPVGDMKLKGIVTIVTLVVSIGGAAAILLFILGFGQKSKRD